MEDSEPNGALLGVPAGKQSASQTFGGAAQMFTSPKLGAAASTDLQRYEREKRGKKDKGVKNEIKK